MATWLVGAQHLLPSASLVSHKPGQPRRLEAQGLEDGCGCQGGGFRLQEVLSPRNRSVLVSVSGLRA